MFQEYRKEIEWGGRTLVLETGKIARQADGAVLVTYGETKVLCTVVAAKEIKPGQGFFPLTVHYVEKGYAAGKIPGGFFKREGRPGENETLTSRLIDRPIRPLFPDQFMNDTQIICTVISHDMDNPPDIPALVGASAALVISGVPFLGPIAAARVGYLDGEYVLNPTVEQIEQSDMDLIVAGTQEGVLMVESEINEMSEETTLGAVEFGFEAFQAVNDAIIDLAKACAKDPWDLPEPPKTLDELKKKVEKLARKDLEKAYEEQEKLERRNKIDAVKEKALEKLVDEDDDDEDAVTAEMVSDMFKKLEKDIVRGQILESGKRIDGRDTETVRPIACEVGILPRAHGSALFTRGETQALVVTTLGTGQDEQIMDRLEGEYRENFLLHYNFPPYSVGEAGRFGFTGRREVGHGKLGWRAIHPLLPKNDDFPYTIRVVSEITESNGSSSMATVCGTSLSLMDAGVPLPRPVAGIAMGLIKEGDKYAVLTDILGDEDHLGDMDFKVAGTDEGITSLQMDIKITSITQEIMKIALDQARDARLHVLGEMSKAMDQAREELNPNAPRIEVIKIDKEKIRDVIGTGGKIIREICEETGAKIDIEDDGTIRVAAVDGNSIQQAIDWIEGLTAEPEVGKVYTGKVVKTVDFGAFVNYMGNRDGLVHISELQEKRTEKTTDVVKEGDIVKVKLIAIDDRGKVKLSMRGIDQKGVSEEAAPS